MSADLPPPTPARRVVRLLWQIARRRAAGRLLRQREIMGHRRREGRGFGAGGLTRIFMTLFMALIVCLIHGLFGWSMVQSARRTSAASVRATSGRIILPLSATTAFNEALSRQSILDRHKEAVAKSARPTRADHREVILAAADLDSALSRLALSSRPADASTARARRAHRTEVELRFKKEGAQAFIIMDQSLRGLLARSSGATAVPAAVLSLFLGWWLLMLVCQGEGLELDVQRRRHPMWEWLLSHPIRPAHAFYAELLAPCMANPIYLTAPVFVWFALRQVEFGGVVWPAALAIGVPIAVATSALGKSAETSALLRLGVRTRGAMLGLVSWFGYVSMILPFFLIQFTGIGSLLNGLLGPAAGLGPGWPSRALLLGWGESPNLLQVTASWWILSGGLMLAAVGLTQWATVRGLQAPSGGFGPAPSKLLAAGSRFGKNPLHRKEFLWLSRDKGAIVQVLLVPLTIGATQAIHFRNVYQLASESWSVFSGIAIICGTYLLLVLGPRSLASEGAALWLSLTWPRGLEDLLRAKARLWSRVANGVVGAILAVTVLLFPTDWWKIAGVGVAWLIFSRMLAFKAVALVTAPSSSGEAEPPDRAKSWIALIGTLAFGSGVMMQAWHVAIMGIVFSSLVAVAMWQGLRARLPFLFDPGSEKPVPAPSLLHATVGIALMVEVVGLAIGLATVLGSPATRWLVSTLVYGVVGSIACIVMLGFLKKRGVSFRDTLRWPTTGVHLPARQGVLIGAVFGAATALVAIGYTIALYWIPAANEALSEGARFARQFEGQKIWLAVLAVILAPLTEEFFFRGLLYRSLDRELGDWRAMAVSAAVFAIFHAPLAWVPVACLGVATAWLFKNTGHLLPCVVCHAAYNAVVIFTPA